MERKIGFPSCFAFASASGPQGNQLTGLCACCSRYGLVSFARRFVCCGSALTATSGNSKDQPRTSRNCREDRLMGIARKWARRDSRNSNTGLSDESGVGTGRSCRPLYDPYVPNMPAPRSAYIHVPFCRHRCGYCNFTLVAGRDDLIDAYLQALEREVSGLSQPREVDTLFFGGGTPSHISPEQLERLFEIVRRWFLPAAGAELSVEVNPIDLCEAKARVFAAAGVTRISLGAQSFQAWKLAALERDHNAATIRAAVERARRFAKSVSLDLIFGVPGELLVQWRDDLQASLALAPDHVSTYGLTFEKGTSFWSRLNRGKLSRLDEE